MIYENIANFRIYVRKFCKHAPTNLGLYIDKHYIFLVYSFFASLRLKQWKDFFCMLNEGRFLFIFLYSMTIQVMKALAITTFALRLFSVVCCFLFYILFFVIRYSNIKKYIKIKQQENPFFIHEYLINDILASIFLVVCEFLWSFLFVLLICCYVELKIKTEIEVKYHQSIKNLVKHFVIRSN